MIQQLNCQVEAGGYPGRCLHSPSFPIYPSITLDAIPSLSLTRVSVRSLRRRGRNVDGGLSKVLDLTLLAVLQLRYIGVSHSVRCPSSYGRIASHLPLGETEIHLSTTLGNESLVLLQAAAHDARGDGEVAVVAGNRGLPG